MDTAALGVMIPIIAVTLSLTIWIVTIVTRHRARVVALEHRHRERMAAIEKGVELPPELGAEIDPDSVPATAQRASRYLLRGLVCLGLGAAFIASTITNVMPEELQLPGAILLSIGAALTLYYVLAAKRDERAATRPDSELTKT